MICLDPEYLQSEGTATEWFAEERIAERLPERLAEALHEYCIEEHYNDGRNRLVLEAILFSVILAADLKLHQDLGITIRGGVGPRDPDCLSIVQVEITDRIGGKVLANLSFTYNESLEEWSAFDMLEVQ